MGFHEDARGTEPPKRERKLARVRAGTAHAALVFDGDNPGLVPIRRARRGAEDQNRAAYEKGLTVSPDWRIACNFVGKGHRRHGVATAALAGGSTSSRISAAGGWRAIQRMGWVPAGFLYHGALSTYESLGFVRDRKSASTAGSLRRWSSPTLADLAARDLQGHSRTLAHRRVRSLGGVRERRGGLAADDLGAL